MTSFAPPASGSSIAKKLDDYRSMIARAQNLFAPQPSAPLAPSAFAPPHAPIASAPPRDAPRRSPEPPSLFTSSAWGDFEETGAAAAAVLSMTHSRAGASSSSSSSRFAPPDPFATKWPRFEPDSPPPPPHARLPPPPPVTAETTRAALRIVLPETLTRESTPGMFEEQDEEDEEEKAAAPVHDWTSALATAAGSHGALNEDARAKVRDLTRRLVREALESALAEAGPAGSDGVVHIRVVHSC